MHSASKAHDTTLHDENASQHYDVHCNEGDWDMTSVVVTALCNQLEAFVSDLGDNQSRYL